MQRASGSGNTDPPDNVAHTTPGTATHVQILLAAPRAEPSTEHIKCPPQLNLVSHGAEPRLWAGPRHPPLVKGGPRDDRHTRRYTDIGRAASRD
jgi:hypothetical protein